MTYPVDPLLPKSHAQALKALRADRLPRRGWREWLAALRPVQTVRALIGR